MFVLVKNFFILVICLYLPLIVTLKCPQLCENFMSTNSLNFTEF